MVSYRLMSGASGAPFIHDPIEVSECPTSIIPLVRHNRRSEENVTHLLNRPSGSTPDSLFARLISTEA